MRSSPGVSSPEDGNHENPANARETSHRLESPRHATSRSVFAPILSLSIRWRTSARRSSRDRTGPPLHHDEIENRHEAPVRFKERMREEQFPVNSVSDVR